MSRPGSRRAELDEIAYINALREAFINLAPDGQCHDGVGTGYFRPTLSQGLPQHGQGEDEVRNGADPANGAADTRACTTYVEGSDPVKIRRYLEAGFGLSDIYCQRFFVIASQARLKRRFARNAFTSVDSLVGTVLSLSAAGETALGIVNAGFGAVNSTFQNMDNSFLVAADLENVRALAQSAQDAYRAEAMRTDHLAISYPAARSVIERYAGICSFTGMRRLVNVSVGAQTRQIDQETARSSAQPGAPAPGAVAPAAAGAAPAKPAAAPQPQVRPEAIVPVPPVRSHQP